MKKINFSIPPLHHLPIILIYNVWSRLFAGWKFTSKSERQRMPTVSKKLTFWQFWQSRLVRQIVMFFELECAMESLAVIRTLYFGWLQLLTHKVDDTVVQIYCVIKKIRVCNLLFIHSIGWRTKAIVFGTDVSQYRHSTDCPKLYNDVAFR